jgi:uncharacterized membrane protein YcaP (DUF421 family)
LAAAIGVPIQAPDRGLKAPVCIALIIVFGQRLIAAATLRSKKFEEISQDDIAIMVEDGRLNLENMHEAVLPQERLFAQLRSKSIDHLGQVKRLYMEANGDFTLLPQDPPHPGLSLIPDWDEEIRLDIPEAPDTYACNRCGNLSESKQEPTTPCPRCSNTHWVQAVVTKTEQLA